MRRGSNNPYDELARELIRPEKTRVVMTGTSTDGGIDIINQDDAWNNPMSAEGDLIVGGESGGPTRRAIGTAGQVLTSDGTTADWEDPTGGTPITELDDVPDVNAPSPSDGDVLTWDSTPGEWVALAPTGGTPYTDEMARDAIGTALVAGNNIDITVNDGGDTITIDVESLSSTDITDFNTAVDERARDAVGTALVAGNNIDITVNDGSDTITIDVEALTSADLSDFAEAAQDAVAGALLDSTSINFTYTDGSNQITADAIFGTSSGTVAEGDHIHDSRYYTETEVDALLAAIPGASGKYRSPTYSTYGGGSILFDTDGHMVYTLESLE